MPTATTKKKTRKNVAPIGWATIPQLAAWLGVRPQAIWMRHKRTAKPTIVYFRGLGLIGAAEAYALLAAREKYIGQRLVTARVRAQLDPPPRRSGL